MQMHWCVDSGFCMLFSNQIQKKYSSRGARATIFRNVGKNTLKRDNFSSGT